MKKAKRYISGMTLLIMAAGLLQACGSDQSGEVTSGQGDTDTTTVETEAPKETPATTQADFGGAEINFMIDTVVQWEHKNDLGTGEQNGDVLNDAYYDRNRKVEDALNVRITNTKTDSKTSDGYKEISKMVLAGDNTYSAMIARAYSVFSLAQENYLLDLGSIGSLDMTHSWWDAGAVEGLTFGGHNFMLTGDISTIINDSTCVMLFNKKLVGDFSLDDPYDLVRNSGWTFDKFGEMCAVVASDIDGNGEYDENDRYGALIWDDSMMAAVNAAGEKCCTVVDGKVELTLNTERTVNTVSKYLSIVTDKTKCFAYQRLSGDNQAVADNMFISNRSLFDLTLIDTISSFRNMETDFGILPYPKYDSAQDRYYTNVASYPAVFLAVPSNVSEPEMIGTVLDMLGYASQEIVRPAYYDKVLVGKYIRDDESRDTLDILFSTRVYDAGWYLAVGGYNERIMDIFRKPGTDFSSMYAKYETKAISQIEKINEAFAADS